MNICLCKMTKELCRCYFKDFVNDPNVYEDLSQFRAYEYSDSHVDEYWQKQQSLDRSHLAIMLDEKPIGEIIFKRIDRNARTCTLSIHLQNDNVKNQGYGTRAEILALDFAFREYQMWPSSRYYLATLDYISLVGFYIQSYQLLHLPCNKP